MSTEEVIHAVHVLEEWLRVGVLGSLENGTGYTEQDKEEMRFFAMMLKKIGAYGLESLKGQEN